MELKHISRAKACQSLQLQGLHACAGRRWECDSEGGIAQE